MSKVKLGRISCIENTDIKYPEAEVYYRVWIEDQNGSNERPLFITEKEFERISKRTDKNLEDWGKRGWLEDILD